MMPRLGVRYPVEIESISKPQAEYQTDDYFELDLPVAPAVMVGGKSWWKAKMFPNTRWRFIFAGNWVCPRPNRNQKGF
jgi:hypothetical protein